MIRRILPTNDWDHDRDVAASVLVRVPELSRWIESVLSRGFVRHLFDPLQGSSTVLHRSLG